MTMVKPTLNQSSSKLLGMKQVIRVVLQNTTNMNVRIVGKGTARRAILQGTDRRTGVLQIKRLGDVPIATNFT